MINLGSKNLNWEFLWAIEDKIKKKDLFRDKIKTKYIVRE
jgi:hypothetical protein